MEVKIGNFKGPKGDAGNTGKQGERGSRWYSGTVITGTSNAATVFSESGITDALKNDMYINTSTSNIYRCTAGGSADTAQWVYEGNIKGEKGEKGEKGDPGKEGGGTIATEEIAGIVKPSTGLTIGEDGTLSVNIDGTTLTMDEVNNVIKLADTLKNAINGAFPAANVANNQITTEAGFALDARQANPNIEGTLAKKISDLNGSLNHHDNFKFRKVIDNWSSASQVSGGCGIYHVNTIEDNFYSLISKHVTTFKNVGDCSLIIFSWNGLDTLNYGTGLLVSPRSTTLCFVQIWAGDFILYDI